MDNKTPNTAELDLKQKPAYEPPELIVLGAEQTEVGDVVLTESAPFGS